MKRRHLLATGAALAVAPWAHAQNAADAGPLRIVVPFPRGGRTTYLAETFAAALRRVGTEPVAVDYRQGDVTAEIRAFAQGTPDARTLLLAGVRLPRRGTPVAPPDAENRLMESLVPVTLVARDPMVLLMNPARADALRIRNTADLLRYLRAHPGQLTIATGVDGTIDHMATELFKSMTRTYLTRLPANGLTPDALGVAGGRVDLLFAELSAAIDSVRDGAFRVLGIACGADDPQPTPRTLGMASGPVTLQQADRSLARFEAYSYYSLFAPPGTPEGLTAPLQQAGARALALPDVRRELLQHSAIPGGQTQAEFLRIEDDEAARWRVGQARW
ncbi:Bug family tripartite tricarboxylate transporter substrate binding protein [Variovorax boronicumulans]|uniref:Bug family tripartite tricarboxylate transporter substrate binding protein n=1 Tax=Variovorax boronicumulans TaxID=436515 RepID=UPI001C59A239